MFSYKNSISKISTFIRAITKPGGYLDYKHGVATGQFTCDKAKKTKIDSNTIEPSKSDEIPCEKLMDVKNKTALITGGTTGIGLAIADALLRAGLHKAYISSNEHSCANEALKKLQYNCDKEKVSYLHLDVNNQTEFEDAFEFILSNDGGVDILVNNAGILNDKNLDLEYETNVKGVIRGSLLANQYMPLGKNECGCVVNIASVMGFEFCPYAPGYNSTNHAVVGFTMAFGDPSNINGVRYIAIGPGVTDTRLVRESAQGMLNEEWGKKTFECLNSVPQQKPATVARGAIYSIEYGPSGSLWVIEDNMLQRVRLPPKECFMTKVIDL